MSQESLSEAPVASAAERRKRRVPRPLAAAGVAALLVGAVWVGAQEQQSSRRVSAIAADQAKDHKDLQALAQKNAALQRQLDQKTEEFDRVAGVAASQANVSKDIITGKDLKALTDLPTYHGRVPGKTQDALKASTIMLISQSPGQSSWQESCTGLDVNVGGQTMIVTAAHCFPNPAIPNKGETPETGAHNITGRDGLTYAVDSNGNEDSVFAPEALIDGVAIDASNDVAFLHVGSSSSTFEEVPRLPYSSMITTSVSRESVGETVFSYGIPTSNGAKPVETEKGHYVGRVIDSANNRQVDVVALPPELNPDEDPCNFGGSGGSAITGSRKLFGPLTARNNIGYPNGKTNPPDVIATHQYYRLQMEGQSRFNLQDVGTLCLYSVLSPTTIPILTEALASPPGTLVLPPAE